MPRAGSAWFRTGRGWYTTVRGRQVPLRVTDPDARAEAEAARVRILAERADPTERAARLARQLVAALAALP